jgi:hypothetical protein
VRGKLEIMSGLPDLGKSQIHCSIAALATTGREWPNKAPGIEPCRVIMLTAEDNTEDVLVPRLQATSANLDLIHELKAIRRNNRDEWFLLGEDLDVLDEMVGDYGDVGLILIDPITAYMGGGKKFDSHRATDVRAQLNPIKVLAEQRSIAISCLTHPPKNASQRALDHFIASQAFIAVPRIGHVCVPEMESDPAGNKRETGRRLFTNPKNNEAGKQPTLAYRTEVVAVGFDDAEGKIIEASRVVWEGEVDITADEALAATRTTKASRGTAQDFLLIILTNGPVPQSRIIECGNERGFSIDQLNRAKRALKIKSLKAGGPGDPWLWVLPEDAPDETEPS